MYIADIAGEVGCTGPLVLQVIRAMRAEGEFFDSRQAGRRVTYRLLLGDEKSKKRQELRRLHEERHRRAELKRAEEKLSAARSAIDEALQVISLLSDEPAR